MVSSNRNAYCDFCVSDKMGWNKISKLSKLGYKTIALNKTIDDTAFETKKKNKKNETREIIDIVPPPTLVPKDNGTQIKILHRLTVQISEVNSCLKVSQSENVKKYDILAVIPTTSATLSHACTTMDVDIISFSPEARSVLKINRKLYKQAVERGVFFEIMYAPALKDSTCRKNIIQRAHLYHAIGKSANIIISSGAETEYQIRGPYDIINLFSGLILGMNEQLCKNSMSENARKVLLKADNRKRGKAAVFISMENKIVTENEDSDFSLPQCKRMKIET